MPLRLVQLTVPSSEEVESLEEWIADHRVVARWDTDDHRMVQLVVEAEETEALLDRCEEAFGDRDGFRVMLLGVEATLPRLEDSDNEVASDQEPTEGEPRRRVSREELVNDLEDTLGLEASFLALTLLSVVVAGVGLMRDDVAVIVGAMVIAPLLGPNIALCLGATLGDLRLIRRALVTNIVGFAAALALALAMGWLFPFDPSVPAIASRTQVGLGSLALALAAGAAGTLAYTRGLSGAVIGVMVAVALVPPLVTLGLLLGAGETRAALGALVLTFANVVCINLAGVATFLAQGVRPRNWWEEKRAHRATGLAIAIWTLLLVALGVIIWKVDLGGL